MNKISIYNKVAAVTNSSPKLGEQLKRMAAFIFALSAFTLITSCTEDDLVTQTTPLAPQGMKTVTVDFQLPEGKPAFGEGEPRATTTDGTWAEGDELMMTVDVSNNNNFAYAYLTLKYDGSAWDVVTDKSYARIILNNAATNYTYADYPLLDDITDLSLAEGLTLVLDEAFGEVTIYSVNATYAPELERNGVDDTGIALLKLKANATTTAPESWSAIASSEDASLTLQWNANQARLRVHTGVAGDVVTLTSQAFLPNDVVTPADGIYTATTDSEGNAYFYGTADSGVVDGSTSHALTSGFNLSLTAVTVGEGNAAFTCHIAPVTLLEASTLVPVQLVGGKSYRLDATEKRTEVPNTIAEIDGTCGEKTYGTEEDVAAVKANIEQLLAAGKTTLLVTGEALAPYNSTSAKTVVGEAIRQLVTSTTFSIVLPGATSIGESAFNGCTALTSVSLPAATSIGDYAFYTCTALTSVSLPAATSIGDGAFYGCVALKSVSLPAAETIGENAFQACTALTSVSLPAAETIGDTAFESCRALTSVSLPAATSIGINAFLNCVALESVSLPKAKTIGDCAFTSCIALTSVSLPAAETIGKEAFRICSALTSVSLPEATTIEYGAFFECTDLTSVSLPAATTIWNSAFKGCTDLTSVSAPKATSIGGSAFWSCDALTSLTFGEVTSVGTNAFYSVPTENCTLTLGTGTTDGNPDVENKTWADCTWKSITLVNSN